MGKAPACSVGSDDVLPVENKWPFLPITPTYDEYVQQSLTFPFPQREGFQVLTRSVMKELRSSVKSLVHFDKFKKRALFKIRVDVWRRAHNCPEDSQESRSGRSQSSSCCVHGLCVLVRMVKYRHHRPSASPLVAFPTCWSVVGLERRAFFPEIDFPGYINF